MQGTLDLRADGVFEAGQLLVLKPGRNLILYASGPVPARIMLVGGELMDGSRYLTWNFVSSSPDLIEQAKEDWRNQRFAKITEEIEFIPLPDIPGKPVRHP